MRRQLNVEEMRDYLESVLSHRLSSGEHDRESIERTVREVLAEFDGDNQPSSYEIKVTTDENGNCTLECEFSMGEG